MHILALLIFIIWLSSFFLFSQVQSSASVTIIDLFCKLQIQTFYKTKISSSH